MRRGNKMESILKVIRFSNTLLTQEEKKMIRIEIAEKMFFDLEQVVLKEIDLKKMEKEWEDEVHKYDPDVIIFNDDKHTIVPLRLIFDWIIPKRRSLIKEIRFNGTLRLWFQFIHGQIIETK